MVPARLPRVTGPSLAALCGTRANASTASREGPPAVDSSVSPPGVMRNRPSITVCGTPENLRTSRLRPSSVFFSCTDGRGRRNSPGVPAASLFARMGQAPSARTETAGASCFHSYSFRVRERGLLFENRTRPSEIAERLLAAPLLADGEQLFAVLGADAAIPSAPIRIFRLPRERRFHRRARRARRFQSL
jgi:hypothetical protein